MAKGYSTFWERNDHQFVLSPEGKVIRYSDIFKLIPHWAKYSFPNGLPQKGSEEDIDATNELCSHHGEIARAICENKGMENARHPTDIISRLGYVLVGGLRSIDMEALTQAQVNALDELN